MVMAYTTMPGPLMFSSRLIHIGRGSGGSRIPFETQSVEPPCVVTPDGEAEQAHPGESRRVQHGPLEFDGVRLDLVDPSRFERGANVADRGPQVELFERERNHHPIRQRPAAACGSSLPEAGAATSPTCRRSTYCTISSASPPTEKPNVSIRPSSQARNTWSMSNRAHPQSPGLRQSPKRPPRVSARVLQPSTKAGAPSSAGSVLACVS